MPKARKFALSAAGALFCLLVILIHILSPVITGADRTTPAYAATLSLWRLSSFVVQGFILTAGVKLGLKLKTGTIDYGRYYLSRAQRIVLPYVAWVAVYYVWFWLRHYYEFSILELLRYIFVGDLAAHFYFIVTIIQFYALAPLWKRLLERIHIAWALPAAAFISLLSAQYLPDLLASFGVSGFAWSDRVFTTYLVWWVAGLFIGCDWDNFAASLERSRPVLAALTVVFGLLDARATYDAWVRGVSHAYAEPLHMIYAVCAIMLVLSLGLLVRDESRAGSVLGEIDRAGYGIYLSHLLVLSATQLVLDYVGITRLLWRTAICAVVTYAVSIGANIAYQKLVGYIKAKNKPAVPQE